jgi:hypothetical protein
MMSGSTVSLVSVLLGVLCSSPTTTQAFAFSVPRQQLGTFRAAESRFAPAPLRAKKASSKASSTSNLDIESLVEEAVAPTPISETDVDVETKSSVMLMNIDPLLTLDEAQLERDEKYMRQAIEMALSA